MILRSFWDEDPCFLDTYPYPASLREQLGQVFSEYSLGPNKRHVCKLTRTYSDRTICEKLLVQWLSVSRQMDDNG
jgi:hypothetical protein